MELSEVETSIEELSKASEEVFKIVGNIMLKSSKENLIKELDKKKSLLELRLKSISSQEASMEKQSQELRKKVLSKVEKH
jgi:prefoldin beta subunit